MHKKPSIFLSFLISFTCLSQAAYSQLIKNREYPQNYFRSPLDIPHQASGTFGELRATHFHAGDDFRTQQRVGLPLFAIANGHVSRVRVQIGGGGNSVYIMHPNGYTSVYLHMHEFNTKLANIVKAEQYRQQRFDVDIPLDESSVPLKKGDRIGLAGNSGSSQGPHLHFEIRDTKTENPLNTQLFGLQFPDNVPPTIHGVTLYDIGDDDFSEHTPRRHQQVKNIGTGKYSLASTAAIPFNGKIGIGINTIDKHTGTSFNNGVYSIELLLDNIPVSTVVFEELSFSTSRAIHSYIDYPHFMLSKAKIQKSFKDPNNPITIFYQLQDDGILDIRDNVVHTLLYRVRDIKGNTSTISFNIQRNQTYSPARKTVPGTAYFHYDRENSYEAENIKLVLPKNALYNNLYFNYSQGSKPAKGFSLMQHVHNNLTPLFESYSLSIKADDTLPLHLRDKALIVDVRGNSHGGTYENGFVNTKTRSLGSFYIGVDTVAPVIRAQNISEGKNMAALARANFTISDDLSGVQSFNGYIDGQWILMQYDPKTRSLWHVFESDLAKGKHQFKLEVMDWKNNKQTYEASFIR